MENKWPVDNAGCMHCKANGYCDVSNVCLLGLEFRLRSTVPLQPPWSHVLIENLVRDLLPPLLELCHVFLQFLDRQSLQFTRQEFTALVAVVDLFELGVVVLEVGQVDIGNVDVGVAAQPAVVFDADLAATKGVLVDFGLLRLARYQNPVQGSIP
jgi:hypothetical protein